MGIITLFGIVILIPYVIISIVNHKHEKELQSEALNRELRRKAQVAALYGRDSYEDN